MIKDIYFIDYSGFLGPALPAAIRAIVVQSLNSI